MLTELLRDNFRNSRVKLAVVPTLGEILHYVASQEEVKGAAVDNWSFNQMTYTLIIRCLREGVSTNSVNQKKTYNKVWFTHNVFAPFFSPF